MSEILKKPRRLWRKRLDGKAQAAVLHEIIGYVFDAGPDGHSFHMRANPECPECGSHWTTVLDELDPPEEVDVDAAVLISTKWQARTKKQKQDLVWELASRVL